MTEVKTQAAVSTQVNKDEECVMGWQERNENLASGRKAPQEGPRGFADYAKREDESYRGK